MKRSSADAWLSWGWDAPESNLAIGQDGVLGRRMAMVGGLEKGQGREREKLTQNQCLQPHSGWMEL